MANTLGKRNPLRYRGYVYDIETGLYYLQSRYYNPNTGRFLNADGLVATGQGVLGNNMFAYCGNNPISNIDSSGALFEKNGGGGGGYYAGYGSGGGGSGGYVYTGPAGGHIVRPTTSPSIPLIIPFVPPSTTYGIDSLREEKFLIYKANLTQEEEEKVKTALITIDKGNKKQVYFPENPLEFMPMWLMPVFRIGSKNGPLITWMTLDCKTEVFRWDMNINEANGPHYHIKGMPLHFYPGDIVPEPWATLFFPYLQ